MTGKSSRVSRKLRFAGCSKSLIKRILLLLAYSISAFGVSWFFALGGHGSYVPFGVLTSWAAVSFHQGLLSQLPELLAFSILLLAYLACLLLLTTTLCLLGFARLSLIPAIMIHAAGVPLVLSESGQSHAYSFDLAWMISAPMVVAYFVIDWRLARGLKAWPEPKD
jgi:hypothetical protein